MVLMHRRDWDRPRHASSAARQAPPWQAPAGALRLPADTAGGDRSHSSEVIGEGVSPAGQALQRGFVADQ